MSTKTLTVSEGAVYAPNLPRGAIKLDTPEWFSWLEAPTTSSFAYPLFDASCGYIIGFMTVRKEQRQRGGEYWSVFRRAGGQVRKIYLGRSDTVTQSRLAAIAEALRTGQVVSGRRRAGSDADKAH
jgi:hypothetical protein